MRRPVLPPRFLLWPVLIGLLFLLPHVAGILRVSSLRAYTPFSVTTPSNVTWDESFLYGAQTNTMLQQHARADDTDTWEGRHTWFPYSVLPEAAEAAVAEVLAPGDARTGLKLAQMLFHFAFPALMAGLLMALLYQPGTSSALAALLALTVMVASFSARTLTGGMLAALSRYGTSEVANTLQASRNPNPNISFVVVLAAMYLLVRAIGSPRRRTFLSAGAVGGLLFYCYTFYAVAWNVACILLSLASLVPALRLPRRIALTLAATILCDVPYLAWTSVSKRTGVYAQRTDRLGMVHSHSVSSQSLFTTVVMGAMLIGLLVVWMVLLRSAKERPGRERVHAALLIATALGLGGIAGLNLQVITGFNVQADFHYTHMVIQPAVVLAAVLLIAYGLRSRKAARWLGASGFAMLFLVCAVVEVRAGIAAAPYQQLRPEDAALFDWLSAHTRPGEVLATNNLRLCLEMPLFTHNRLLAAGGTRAAGTDEELLERLLAANRLTGATEQTVRNELTGADPIPDGVRMETYGTYLFEQSPLLSTTTHSLTGDALATALDRYGHMDAEGVLERYRVDYVYTESGAMPQLGASWQAAAVLPVPGGGVLWRLTRRTPRQ